MAEMMGMALTTDSARAGRAFEIEITLLPRDDDDPEPVMAVEVHRKSLLRRLNRQLFGKPRSFS